MTSQRVASSAGSGYPPCSPQESPSAVRHVAFQFASANVNTLLPHEEGRAYARTSVTSLLSKVTLLETQFKEHSIDAVGVQEGRAKTGGVFNGMYYTRIVAAADPLGQYGVQLWLRAESQFHVLQWKAVAPRLLFAVCRSRTVSMVFIVAHAPSETSPVEDKDSFWDSFWTVTLSLKSKFPVFHFVVLGDMNARVGSVPSRSIGQEQSRTIMVHFGAGFLSSLGWLLSTRSSLRVERGRRGTSPPPDWITWAWTSVR